MNINAFRDQDYQSLFQEFETLIKVETSQGDKLAVNNGALEISKGGFLQAPVRTIKNLIHGGYNRDAVVDHLEKIAGRTQQFINSLDPNYLSYGDEFRQFVKTLCKVSTTLSDIEYSYRDIQAFPVSKDKTCEKLSDLFETFHTISHNLKQELKSDEWKKIPKPPKKPIDFEAPINLRKIKYHMPKNQTPADTIQLAEVAKSQIVPLYKKVGTVALYVLTILVVGIPLSFSNAIKWVVWNPIEFALKGKVTTINPFAWWINSSSFIMDSAFDPVPEKAIELYAKQLLHTPIITDAHVKAFCKLASHVEEIDFGTVKLGSKNCEELWSIVEDKNIFKSKFSPEALRMISQDINNFRGDIIAKNDFYFYLKKVKLYFKYQIKDHLSEEKNRQYLNKLSEALDTKVSKINPIISLSGLCKILEAVGKNSKCHDIKYLPNGTEKMESVLAILAKYGFKQNQSFKANFSR